MTAKDKGFKTRGQIAKEWKISRKHLYNKLKAADFELPAGKINQENQKQIDKILASN